MVYYIENERLKVGVSDLGAEIVSVIFCGKERSWQNEDGSWAGHAPILFPVCGNSAVIVGGVDRKINFHGFARKSVFTLEKKSEKSVTFSLKSDENTLKVYPYFFALYITYEVTGDTVKVVNTIENLGDTVMPFAIGRHDSYALDADVDEYKIVFPKAERFLSLKTVEDARITGEADDLGGGKELDLPKDYLSFGRTIILENVSSDHLFLCRTNGEKKVRVDFNEVNNVLLWRPHGAKMVCIEPWSALPDRVDRRVEFTENEKYYRIPAGGKKTIELSATYY